MPRFGRLRRGANNDPLVDIERLLVDYAWTELAEPGLLDRLLRHKRYTLEVNWAYFAISHHVTAFKMRQRDAPGGGCEAKPESRDLDRLRSKVMQRDLCLFRTEFKNASSEAQTFTFKTERTTTSRCDVSIQKGFRIGANVDVRMAIPAPGQAAAGQQVEMCRVTGGLSGELHVTKSTGQTFEEQLTWSVDSQVQVAAGSRALAALLIREEELVADFTVDSVIRALYHVIPVYVKDKKTGRVLELLEINSDNLADILSESEGFTKIDATAVKCETRGSTRLVYGAEQVIDLKSVPLELAESGSGLQNPLNSAPRLLASQP